MEQCERGRLKKSTSCDARPRKWIPHSESLGLRSYSETGSPQIQGRTASYLQAIFKAKQAKQNFWDPMLKTHQKEPGETLNRKCEEAQEPVRRTTEFNKSKRPYESWEHRPDRSS